MLIRTSHLAGRGLLLSTAGSHMSHSTPQSLQSLQVTDIDIDIKLQIYWQQNKLQSATLAVISLIPTGDITGQLSRKCQALGPTQLLALNYGDCQACNNESFGGLNLPEIIIF